MTTAVKTMRIHDRFHIGLGFWTACAVLMATSLWAQQDPIAVKASRITAGDVVVTDTYFGTVRASEISSLSYGARGCIIELSEASKRERTASGGEQLVRLDDARSTLSLRSAEARVQELSAALEERELAIDAARADDNRRREELDFVAKEFQRNSVMLGRGLINEATMETIERRFMDARFTAERAKEAIANAETAFKRAQIALEIGRLDLQSAAINRDMFTLTAPFDGVLIGFDANVGDCVQEGALAARIYDPAKKSVDVFFPISRLAASNTTGLSIGASVTVTRVNEQRCSGAITRLDSEADPETQFVEATVEVETSCAPGLFLNESVEVDAIHSVIENAVRLPNEALVFGDTAYLVDEENKTLIAATAEILSSDANSSVVRIADGDGRLVVMRALPSMQDGQPVRVENTE